MNERATKAHRPWELYRVTGPAPSVVGRSGLDDMARYDACCIIAEGTNANGGFEATVSYPRGKKPTKDRWASFGYHIVQAAPSGAPR